MAVFGYSTKLKRGLELAFGAYFLHDFLHKNGPYLILYQLTKSQYCTFFPSQGIKQSALSSFY